MPSYTRNMQRFAEACLDAWGSNDQIDMMFEEMGELTVALTHWKRGRATIAEVAEEIADVELMCLQMRAILDYAEPSETDTWTSDQVNVIAEEKIKRTLTKLEKRFPEIYEIHYGEDS